MISQRMEEAVRVRRYSPVLYVTASVSPLLGLKVGSFRKLLLSTSW
jgi:hypothetical protein